jgi:hypothetical protein
MKKLFPFLFVLATPVILLLMSNSTGSPGGKSGSIGDDGNTCTDCHGGSATTMPGWITTNVPAEGYTPGQTYIITATGTHPGVVKFGFELTVENSQGAKVGTLQLTDPTRTKFTNANQAITHTAAGNIPTGNTNSWSMNWVAPSNIQGNVGIYAAFNAANGNGNTGGDVIYKSSIFISQYTPPPVLVSIVPNQAEQGDSFNGTVFGENTGWSGTPSVYLSHINNPNETITGTNVSVVSPTEISADFDIPYPATPGSWDLHVDELMLTNAFTVIDVVPFLVSIEPDSTIQGETLTTVITAADSRFTLFTPVIFLNFPGDPLETIEASSVTVINDEVAEAVFSIPADASPGSWNVNVDDMILENAFTVELLSGITSNIADMMKIYPNPADQRFFIDNSNGAELLVYSLKGELMINIKVLNDKQEVNISQLSRGLYFVNIRMNGMSRIEKLIIN